jgi:hypothetical protein
MQLPFLLRSGHSPATRQCAASDIYRGHTSGGEQRPDIIHRLLTLGANSPSNFPSGAAPNWPKMNNKRPAAWTLAECEWTERNASAPARGSVDCWR